MGLLSFLGGERTDKTTGKKKSVSEQTIEGLTAQEQAKTSTGVTSATGSTVESVTAAEEAATTQVGATTQIGTTAGTQAGETTAFSEGALGSLENVFGRITGNITEGIPQSVSKLIGQVEGFDPQKFIANVVAKAQGGIDRTLEPALNQLASSVGGTANSAVQILRNQAEADAAAQIAGVESDATLAANQILSQNIQSALGGQAQEQQLLGLVGELLKGGRTTTTGQFASEEAQAGTSEQAGTTTGTSESQKTGSSQSQEVVELTELINSLIKQNQKSTASEEVETEGTATTGASFAGFLDPISRFIAAGG